MRRAFTYHYLTAIIFATLPTTRTSPAVPTTCARAFPACDMPRRPYSPPYAFIGTTTRYLYLSVCVTLYGWTSPAFHYSLHALCHAAAPCYPTSWLVLRATAHLPHAHTLPLFCRAGYHHDTASGSSRTVITVVNVPCLHLYAPPLPPT